MFLDFTTCVKRIFHWWSTAGGRTRSVQHKHIQIIPNSLHSYTVKSSDLLELTKYDYETTVTKKCNLASSNLLTFFSCLVWGTAAVSCHGPFTFTLKVNCTRVRLEQREYSHLSGQRGWALVHIQVDLTSLVRSLNVTRTRGGVQRFWWVQTG